MSPPLFENFSMTLEPGKSVAFIGFSGCGKSTLAKLITGLYTPWSGEVLFDGINIADIDRNEFTASVAMVDQDIVLFEGTIADNIRLWDVTIEDYDIVLAARDAQIHSDIIARENGYQGMLTEGGKNLSGGQRQRIEIARVLAQNPTLIVMDEATSALDNITQKHVSDSLEKMGCTRIVIAHRLSTIQNCDRILVMDRGQIVGD
jgi:ABC-type bacteriocin/lantibiotic exporter with double-glycine peptidase domain